MLFNYPAFFLPSLRPAGRNMRPWSPVPESAITAPWKLHMQLDAWRSLSAMEDTIPTHLQENHVAQILILYVKSRRKMNGRKTSLQNFLKIATQLSPGGYSQDVAWWQVWRRNKVSPHQIPLCFHPLFHEISNETRECCTTWCPSIATSRGIQDLC